ncbi:MAG: hypothetical protein ACYCU7_16460 [Acidimicrobiales bacterium]
MNADFPLNDHGVPMPAGTAIGVQLRRTIGGLAERWKEVTLRRHHRPWLALVAVPLAVVAAVCTFQFWLVIPLLALSWWWAPVDWPWGWLLAVLEACFGVQWVYSGAIFLDGFPNQRIVVGTLWALYAGIIAAAGMYNRRTTGRRYGW